MKALAGRIPRGFKNHRSPEGRVYLAFCRPIAARFPNDLPADVRVQLQMAGRLKVRIEWAHEDLERAHARGRQREVGRIRRALAGMDSDMRGYLAFFDRRAKEETPSEWASIVGGRP